MANLRHRHTSERQTGVAMPLFDRLSADGSIKSQTFTCFDALYASIFTHLDHLLNTRRTAIHDGRQEDLKDSPDILSRYAFPAYFGLTDFSYFDTASETGRRQMAGEIRSVITYFEPRLHVQNVVLRKMEKDTLALFADITGHIHLNGRREKVHFPLALRRDDGKQRFLNAKNKP